MVAQSQFIEMTKATSSIKLEDVAKGVFAGGDKPKDYSAVQGELYKYPVFSNGIGDNALLCFSKECRVKEAAITVSARGTIGYAECREAGFTPVVRLLTLIPKDGYQLSYLKFALNNVTFRSTGSSQGQLTAPDFCKYEIPNAPKDVQLAFESIVHQVDKSKFDGLKSQFIEMFGDIKTTSFPVYKLGEICDIHRGGSPRPISEYITNDPDGLNWIKIGDADEGMYISHTAEKIKPSGLNKTRKVYAGDLLLSNSMSFGRPYILRIDGCIHDGWLVLHFNHKNIEAEYLCSYLSQDSTYQELSKLAAGGVVNNLNSEVVKILPTILPPIEEQREYLAVLHQADKSKYLS